MHIIQAALPQVVMQRDALGIASDLAIVVTGLAVIALAGVLILSVLEVRSAIRELRIGIRQNLGPVSDRARSISANVEFITDTLRDDVRHLTAAVNTLRTRLEQASDHMETRVEEFNALLETVQAEAEDLFLDTAAGVHGIRESARSITNARKGMRSRPDGPPDSDSVEPVGAPHAAQ